MTYLLSGIVCPRSHNSSFEVYNKRSRTCAGYPTNFMPCHSLGNESFSLLCNHHAKCLLFKLLYSFIAESDCLMVYDSKWLFQIRGIRITCHLCEQNSFVVQIWLNEKKGICSFCSGLPETALGNSTAHATASWGLCCFKACIAWVGAACSTSTFVNKHIFYL